MIVLHTSLLTDESTECRINEYFRECIRCPNHNSKTASRCLSLPTVVVDTAYIRFLCRILRQQHLKLLVATLCITIVDSRSGLSAFPAIKLLFLTRPHHWRILSLHGLKRVHAGSYPETDTIRTTPDTRLSGPPQAAGFERNKPGFNLANRM
jgi:hypothetical protein